MQDPSRYNLIASRGCGVVWTCGAVCIAAEVVAARSAAICDGMGSFVEGRVGDRNPM
jgi:hypothetical protein